MNHRYGVRKLLRMQAILVQRGKYLGNFNTRNIGFGGAFVNNTPEKLLQNTIVDMVILPPCNNIPVCFLKALIMRKDESGIGLAFADYGDEVRIVMKNLLLCTVPDNWLPCGTRSKYPCAKNMA